jgi:hypothetical protein
MIVERELLAHYCPSGGSCGFVAVKLFSQHFRHLIASQADMVSQFGAVHP